MLIKHCWLRNVESWTRGARWGEADMIGRLLDMIVWKRTSVGGEGGKRFRRGLNI